MKRDYTIIDQENDASLEARIEATRGTMEALMSMHENMIAESDGLIENVYISRKVSRQDFAEAVKLLSDHYDKLFKLNNLIRGLDETLDDMMAESINNLISRLGN